MRSTMPSSSTAPATSASRPAISTPGPTGAPRTAGPTGPTGPQGLTWQGTWTGATTYALNDAVQFNGTSYISIQARNLNPRPNRRSPDRGTNGTDRSTRIDLAGNLDRRHHLCAQRCRPVQRPQLHQHPGPQSQPPAQPALPGPRDQRDRPVHKD